MTTKRRTTLTDEQIEAVYQEALLSYDETFAEIARSVATDDVDGADLGEYEGDGEALVEMGWFFDNQGWEGLGERLRELGQPLHRRGTKPVAVKLEQISLDETTDVDGETVVVGDMVHYGWRSGSGFSEPEPDEVEEIYELAGVEYIAARRPGGSVGHFPHDKWQLAKSLKSVKVRGGYSDAGAAVARAYNQGKDPMEAAMDADVASGSANAVDQILDDFDPNNDPPELIDYVMEVVGDLLQFYEDNPEIGKSSSKEPRRRYRVAGEKAGSEPPEEFAVEVADLMDAGTDPFKAAESLRDVFGYEETEEWLGSYLVGEMVLRPESEVFISDTLYALQQSKRVGNGVTGEKYQPGSMVGSDDVDEAREELSADEPDLVRTLEQWSEGEDIDEEEGFRLVDWLHEHGYPYIAANVNFYGLELGKGGRRVRYRMGEKTGPLSPDIDVFTDAYEHSRSPQQTYDAMLEQGYNAEGIFEAAQDVTVDGESPEPGSAFDEWLGELTDLAMTDLDKGERRPRIYRAGKVRKNIVTALLSQKGDAHRSVSLWVANDEGLYNMAREAMDGDELAQLMEEFILEGNNPIAEELLRNALSEVNWQEIWDDAHEGEE